MMFKSLNKLYASFHVYFNAYLTTNAYLTAVGCVSTTKANCTFLASKLKPIYHKKKKAESWLLNHNKQWKSSLSRTDLSSSVLKWVWVCCVLSLCGHHRHDVTISPTQSYKLTQPSAISPRHYRGDSTTEITFLKNQSQLELKLLTCPLRRCSSSKQVE